MWPDAHQQPAYRMVGLHGTEGFVYLSVCRLTARSACTALRALSGPSHPASIWRTATVTSASSEDGSSSKARIAGGGSGCTRSVPR
jgi:hypothetical protein